MSGRSAWDLTCRAGRVWDLTCRESIARPIDAGIVRRGSVSYTLRLPNPIIPYFFSMKSSLWDSAERQISAPRYWKSRVIETRLRSMSTAATMIQEQVPTGLPGVGSVPWGTHMCHFYRSPQELCEPLVEFFRAGLDNGELCLWVTSDPLLSSEARAALARVVPNLDDYERSGQLYIGDFQTWYVDAGEFDSDKVVESWLQREQRALEAGFKGVRLTGNTSWLEPSNWDEFTAYEACAHAAFHQRRIVALCSYPLESCNADAVLEVQRNHEFSLICQGGVWETVRNGTQLLAAIDNRGPAPHTEHSVRFFSQDNYPAEAIAGFLSQGAYGCAAVIAPAPHLSALGAALRRQGADPSGVLMYDTDKIMREVAGRDGLIAALSEMVEEVVLTTTRDSRKAYIYGELVDVLSQSGDKAAAVALEQVWNDLLRQHDFALWCGYSLEHFNAEDAQACTAVCGCHGDVQIDTPGERQQLFARALVDEISLRRLYEKERSRLLQLERNTNLRLSQLQGITSALSEAVTAQDVAEVVCAEIRTLLGAASAFLSAPDGQGRLRLLAQVGVLDEAWGDCLASPTDPGATTRMVFHSSRPLWLSSDEEISARLPCLREGAGAFACLPLSLHGRRLGIAGFAYPRAQLFDSAQRAFLEDTCKQVSLALERARLYDEAERQRARAESAGRAKDQFIAMLGHELRNPLAAIHTAAELLGLPHLSPEIVARTQKILSRQAGHMSKLIDDLLDVSRIVWGKINLDFSEVDLTALVCEALDDRREQLAQRKLTLSTDFAAPALWVRADRVRLMQVLENILVNAVKFSHAGGTLQVSLAAVGDAQAVLRVKDNGAGIDPELLPHIFEPFQQGGQDLARSSGGLGLGLTLVKGLVDMHQGELSVTSDGCGKGCEVQVRLPLTGASQAVARLPNPVPATVRQVLIVEDNQDAAELLSELLRREGHAVAVAYSGEQALQAAQRVSPDLVLCDLGLPGGMDGFEIAAAMRRLNPPCRAYLVALTGYAAPEDVTRALQAGFDEHVTKPVSQGELKRLFAAIPTPKA